MLVEMTWPFPMGFLALPFYADVVATILLAYSYLRPTSLFASLAYTYLLLLGSLESERCLQLTSWMFK